MKKLILPLLLLVAIGMLAAVQSDPSDVVGYFKRPLYQDGWDAFALPFGYDSYEINAILGSQFGVDDFIGDISGSDVWFCIADYDGMGNTGWVGTSLDLLPGKGYWINRAVTNPNMDFYLLGKVDPSVLLIDVAGADAGGWSAFGLDEAREIDLNILPIGGVLVGDFIGDISGADVFFYIDDYDGLGNPGWVGTAMTLVPTHAYWYNSLAATSYSWTYTPLPPSPGGRLSPGFGTGSINNKVRN
jgi:hypothetical protein